MTKTAEAVRSLFHLLDLWFYLGKQVDKLDVGGQEELTSGD